jgi:RNA recognition motif-containing protein
MKGKYAFIEFKDEKDAAVAVVELHNTQLAGQTITVEHTRKNAGGARGGRSGP